MGRKDILYWSTNTCKRVKPLLTWHTVHLDICHCPACDNKYMSLSVFLFIIIPMGYKNIADDKSSFRTESHLIWNLRSSEGTGHELRKEIFCTEIISQHHSIRPSDQRGRTNYSGYEARGTKNHWDFHLSP